MTDPQAGAAEAATKKKIRRRYKVDRLPGKAQGVIFGGYVRGDSYAEIRKQVAKLGHEISENALSRYWRNQWGAEVDRIRKARAYKEALKEGLQLDEGSENGRIAEEVLYTTVFKMLDQLEAESPLQLLREGREQAKAESHEKTRTAGRDSQSAAEQAREVRRRWRKLYGLDSESNDDTEEKEEA